MSYREKLLHSIEIMHVLPKYALVAQQKLINLILLVDQLELGFIIIFAVEVKTDALPPKATSRVARSAHWCIKFFNTSCIQSHHFLLSSFRGFTAALLVLRFL